MSGDDDTIIIRHKLVAAITKPVTLLKRWHVAALMALAWALGKFL